MRLWQAIYGKITLDITCADSVQFLNGVSAQKVNLENVTYRSELELRATICHNDYQTIRNIAEKQGGSVKIAGKSGLYWIGKAVLKRPVLIGFLTVLLIFSAFVSSRIFFISVEGNDSIPDRYIIEAAAQCGIRFGAVRRDVRSEKMKNALLERIPQLQWAGINTSGCTAIISVREKTTQEAAGNGSNQISSIVAARDGIIQNCTVYQGNPLCTVGQAVKAGQTLVSGYIDCGIVTKGTKASAEIRALTLREIHAVAPAPDESRGLISDKRNYYSLRIGKKLIKFYKDSGNLDISCGKIYLEDYARLPGGFQLPIAIIKETYISYKQASQEPVVSDWDEWMTDFAKEYLLDVMVAGQIISRKTEITPSDNVCYLYGRYTCLEMIGQVRYEQTLQRND